MTNRIWIVIAVIVFIAALGLDNAVHRVSAQAHMGVLFR